jgi:hypothetical protein
MGGYCQTLLQLTIEHTNARIERLNGSLRSLQRLQLLHTEYLAGQLIDNNVDRDSVSPVLRLIYD